MYQALYRKYRPRTFSDVAGQEHVTVTLRRQIISGRQSHAYLFVGTRGTGKTTCAKVLSRAINCLNPIDGDPCNECTSCIGIENGSILDVLELDAASNNGVDDVRALREEAIYSPATVSKRVYIIDEVHMLSNSAFNALLKILEEPPEHLLFILATTALHKVPATILSRCQRFSFKRLSYSAIIERLHFVAKNEGLTLTEDAAKELAVLADGSMRDALSLLDQCASDKIVNLQRVLDTIGLVGHQELLGLVEAVALRNMTTALSILDKAYNDGRDMSSLLSETASLMRDVLIFKLSPDSPLLSGGFGHNELTALSANLSPERLFSSLEVIREAVSALSRSSNAKLTVEMSLIRICDERLSDDIPALLSRIERLEDAQRKHGSVRRAAGVNTPETQDKRETHTQEAQGEEESDVQVAHGEIKAGTQEINGDIETGTKEMKGEIETGTWETQGEIDANVQEKQGSDFWNNILERLKSDMSIYSLLSDSTKVQAELRDNVIIIRAGDVFTVSLIDSKKFSDPLKEAARNVIGPDTLTRVELGGGHTEENRTKKIDDLSRFGVVEFE